MGCYLPQTTPPLPLFTSPLPLPPHIARLLHPPAAMLSGLEGRGDPPPTSDLGRFSVTSPEIEDGTWVA
jgi:hypothetical protein